ncbi:21 kDa protein-like [Miscanthus floridulus]|uniref:21 kDa protein-like n=1 Tax=Miscanthus floridulus TaxID=154761 RepID=UPI00345A3825
MAVPQPRAALTIHHLRRHLVLIVFTVAAAATRGASTHTTAASSAPSAATESPSPAAASFLRARCATTLYPALCYDSLLPYASEVQENPARLARVAADVAAARLRALSARVKDILRHGGGGAETSPAEGEGGGGRPSEIAALRDCASTISAAASLARQSSAELTKLEPDAAAGTTSSSSSVAGGGMSSSRQARWEVSNAKTWLSAAMANEGTCADGLVEAGAAAASSSSGKEVTAGVAAVKQYTSNALALVNGIPV